MERIRLILYGKKTYLIAAIYLLQKIYEFSTSDMSTGQFIDSLFYAAGATTIRAGISKKQ